MTLAPSDPLAPILLRDEKLKANVAEAIIGAPTLDLQTTAVSQFTVSLEDPGFKLLDRGLFAQKTPLVYRDLHFEVAALETGGLAEETLTVSARSRGAQLMNRRKGAKVWRDLSPTSVMEHRARDAGLAFVGEPSPKRKRVARLDAKGDRPESDWTMGERLARELGYWLFESAGTLYFARPRWLVKRSRDLTVRWLGKRAKGDIVPVAVPVARRSVDSADGATVSVDVEYDDADGFRPGRVLELAGVPTFAKDYIVTGVIITLDGVSPPSIEAATPVDPKPEPPDTNHDDRSGQSSSGPAGGSTERGPWVWPVHGAYVSGPFGVDRGDHIHAGVDLAVGRGTRIYASKAGTITLASYYGGYGNAVIVDHGGGWTSLYGHMLHDAVAGGQHVAQGQVIGYVDSTGSSTGDHLHFEIRHNGVALDPMGFLP